ncbi:MAG: heavy-metal-associated domain-containing protein [Candidatus Eisenbacteria bacterium]|nr:heavy-metal-associated domain-containing protein [Candidatus Eisenbacteria bacterium]
MHPRSLIALLVAVLVAVLIAFLFASRASRSPSSAGQGQEATSGASRASETPVRTVILDVEGMHCASCVRRVTEFLEKTPGVVSAKVSLEEKSARVDLSTNDPIEDALVEAVVAAGYRATPRAQ